MTRQLAIREARMLLENERSDAWKEYLDVTRGHQDFKYEEVEPWAWRQLRRRLGQVEARELELDQAVSSS